MIFSMQVVNEEYQKKQAQAGHSQPIEFESEQIELDIPMTGVTSGGLTIEPLYSPVIRDINYYDEIIIMAMHPQIIKKKVDNFQPGKMIPKCELNVSFTWSEPPLRYCVKIVGAKDPYNKFNIIPSTTTTISTERRGIYYCSYNITVSSQKRAHYRISAHPPLQAQFPAKVYKLCLHPCSNQGINNSVFLLAIVAMPISRAYSMHDACMCFCSCA